MIEWVCFVFFIVMSIMCCFLMGVFLRCGILVMIDWSYFCKYFKDFLGVYRRLFVILRLLVCMFFIFLVIEIGNVVMEYMVFFYYIGFIKCMNGLYKVIRLCFCLRGKNFWLLGDCCIGVFCEYVYDFGFLLIMVVFKC